MDLSVLQMVPISFGRCARAQTAVGPRPFTTTGARQAGPAEATSFGARTVEALKREVSIFKRRERMLEALRVSVFDLATWFVCSLCHALSRRGKSRMNVCV